MFLPSYGFSIGRMNVGSVALFLNVLTACYHWSAQSRHFLGLQSFLHEEDKMPQTKQPGFWYVGNVCHVEMCKTLATDKWLLTNGREGAVDSKTNLKVLIEWNNHGLKYEPDNWRWDPLVAGLSPCGLMKNIWRRTFLGKTWRRNRGDYHIQNSFKIQSSTQNLKLNEWKGTFS